MRKVTFNPIIQIITTTWIEKVSILSRPTSALKLHIKSKTNAPPFFFQFYAHLNVRKTPFIGSHVFADDIVISLSSPLSSLLFSLPFTNITPWTTGLNLPQNILTVLRYNLIVLLLYFYLYSKMCSY